MTIKKKKKQVYHSSTFAVFSWFFSYAFTIMFPIMLYNADLCFPMLSLCFISLCYAVTMVPLIKGSHCRDAGHAWNETVWCFYMNNRLSLKDRWGLITWCVSFPSRFCLIEFHSLQNRRSCRQSLCAVCHVSWCCITISEVHGIPFHWRKQTQALTL